MTRDFVMRLLKVYRNNIRIIAEDRLYINNIIDKINPLQSIEEINQLLKYEISLLKERSILSGRKSYLKEALFDDELTETEIDLWLKDWEESDLYKQGQQQHDLGQYEQEFGKINGLVNIE